MKIFQWILVLILAPGLVGAAEDVSHNMVKPENDLAVTSRLPARDGADEVIWSEDFENGAEGWTTSDLKPVAWHKSDFLEREEDNLHWWCGDTLPYEEESIGYDNAWLQYLDTPVLDLSEAGDGLTLTFDAWWLIEDPRIVPPGNPYDGWDTWLVVISENGGEDFEILIPESPEYSASRSSALERFWMFEGEWPGWVFHSTNDEWADSNRYERPDVDWVEVTFDLSDYSSEETVIRFMLASDRAVSAAPDNVHQHEYLDESGILIDNILLQDEDERVFLRNNADDDPEPDELIPGLDPNFSGDFWELTDGSSNSGDWSMWNDDDHFNLMNAVDSPPIELPEGMTMWFEFYVWCDMPDYDSNGDNTLEDFYQMYVSGDEGETWEYITHDYARAESGGRDWTHYQPGLPYTGNIQLDLSDYEGETIQLRWVMRTDNNHDDGNGRGLFIDDIKIIGTNMNMRDTGMDNLYIPYPTTVGLRRTGFTVDIHNFGLRDQDPIYASWSWGDGVEGHVWPIFGPRPGIEAGEFETLELTDYQDRNIPGWTPTVPGIFEITAYTALGSNTPNNQDDDDENFTNDTARVSGVTVWPTGLYELGYDNRTVQYYHVFEPGTGAATRFTPGDDGIEEYSLTAAYFRFNGAQEGTATFTLHVLGEGEADAPGEELLSFDVDVPPDSCGMNSMTVPLFEHEELRGLSGDFWFWAEVQSEDGRPQIIGDEPLRGEGHFFTYDGENATVYERDLIMHAMIVPTTEVEPNMAGSFEWFNFDDVYIGFSLTKSYTFYSIGLETLVIESVSSSEDVFEVDWPGEVALTAGQGVTFDITYSPAEVGEHVGELIIVSNDETPPVVFLIGFCMAVDDDPDELMPLKFGLSEPRPNPFNAVTRLDYSLEITGDVSMSLYDLSGREVLSLVDGFKPAGRYSVSLKAGELPSGLYLLRLMSGSKMAVRKLALIR